MKGCTSWSYAPYCPPLFDGGEVYVCRLAPACTGVTADWLATGSDRYTVTVTEAAGSAAVLRETVSRCTVTVTGLCPDTEYALQVETMEGRRSRSRRFRTGAATGTVVNYLHPQIWLLWLFRLLSVQPQLGAASRRLSAGGHGCVRSWHAPESNAAVPFRR